jgi:branched-chain amino acid aminotransferase
MPGLMVFSISNGKEPIRMELALAENSLDEVSRLLPQGVYSTFRTLNNCEKVLGLKTHMERLYAPAAEIGIPPSVTVSELRKMLKRLLEAYQPGEARVRISLSLVGFPGKLFVAIEPLKLLDEMVYQRGIKVLTSLASRNNPRLKSTTFISESASERHNLISNGIFEALMERNGRILEGLTSNFYAVRDGKIITARYGILLGVTRRFVLRLARSAGYGIDYRALRVAELSGINEAFITSSSRGVVPVVEVDHSPVGQGSPGKAAKELRQSYDAYISTKAEKI